MLSKISNPYVLVGVIVDLKVGPTGLPKYRVATGLPKHHVGPSFSSGVNRSRKRQPKPPQTRTEDIASSADFARRSC